MPKSFLNALLSFILLSVVASAAEIELTLQPDKELNRIDEKIYSQFLEHIYHSVNGGLWGDLVWNRSFEDNTQGGWACNGNEIVQKSLDVDQRFVFGDPNWSDYELTLEARKTGGTEGFLVLYRVQNDKEFSWVNLGGWQNTKHAVERRGAKQNRQSAVGPMVAGTIETGKWYEIKIRCEGNNVKVSLDGKQILDVTDPEAAKAGCVGIGTWATQAEFRNIGVKSLDDKTVLLDKTPDVARQIKLRHWESSGAVDLALSDDAVNGKSSVKITTKDEPGGIQQKGFVIRDGETYIVSCWMKKLDGKGEIPFHFHFQHDIPKGGLYGLNQGVLTNEWKQFQVEYKPVSEFGNDDAIFRILIPAHSTALVDQISVMPKSWAASGGFRPDLLNAIDGIKPKLIRWPGGCFASAYRWKDGIGSQDKRGPYPFTIWDDREVNSYGTDEFIAMCRRIGAEPMIVINAGTPGWNAKRTPECADVDWVQEACDWIEYCNGTATSKWGKIRAENGHPEPYNVKYWEIDNETQGGVTVEEYIAIVKKFAPAMRKTDPSIKLAVAGSHFGPREKWDFPIIDEAGNLFDYLSFHQYDNPDTFADGPGKIEQYFRTLQAHIEKSPNKDVKIFDSEWNAQSTDWRTGLYCGGILNVFERCGNVVEIAAPALFLRHDTATDWDNAFVNFDNKSWYPAPNYVVMKLWREHYAPIRIGLEGDAKKLNVVATKSEDGKILYVKAVNPTDKECTVSLNVGKDVKQASLRLVKADSLRDRNTLDKPDAIKPEDRPVTIIGRTVGVVLPAYSAGVVTIQ